MIEEEENFEHIATWKVKQIMIVYTNKFKMTPEILKKFTEEISIPDVLYDQYISTYMKGSYHFNKIIFNFKHSCFAGLKRAY